MTTLPGPIELTRDTVAGIPEEGIAGAPEKASDNSSSTFKDVGVTLTSSLSLVCMSTCVASLSTASVSKPESMESAKNLNGSNYFLDKNQK